MLIYKILRAEEWAAFQSAGETHGAPVDLADGYIHFSTAQQLRARSHGISPARRISSFSRSTAMPPLLPSSGSRPATGRFFRISIAC